MTGGLPLSSRLSQVLVAFTIEFDNESEHRMQHRTASDRSDDTRRGPWLVSMVMWANFMRFIPAPGVPLRDVEGLANMTNLGGLQRWGYVTVEPDPADARPKPPRSDWLVRPTRHGRSARAIWEPLAEAIEQRWRDRFGPVEIDELRGALQALTDEFDAALPHYLPVVKYPDGMRTAPHPDGRTATPGERFAPNLAALLSQVLLAFTLEFERASELSLPMYADVLRVLTEDGIRVRDLPSLTGVSKEAISAAVGFLDRRGCVVVEPDPTASRTKVVRLTPKGRKAQDTSRRLLDATEEGWRARFGGAVDRLRESLQALLDHRDGEQSLLSVGLQPYPDGWRARAPYLTHTAALIHDPGAALPHHPMVLHRGGYPDGS